MINYHDKFVYVHSLHAFYSTRISRKNPARNGVHRACIDYLFIYLFIKLRHSHGYKQVAGSPQQCTPITVGPSKIIKYGQFGNTTQLIAIQHHTVQYNTIQYMYNTIHHNRIQYYSKDKIQLPPPLPPPAAEYLVYRANQLHAH